MDFAGSRFIESVAKAIELRALLLVLALLCLLACHRHDPQKTLEHARGILVDGDMGRAADEAARGYREFHTVSPLWAWEFTLVRAEALHWQGESGEALKVMASEPATPPTDELAIRERRLKGLAYIFLGNLPEAERQLKEAEALCSGSDSSPCGDVESALGTLEMKRAHYPQAQVFFERVLAIARAQINPSWESSALLDLSWAADEQTHFDEALDWARAAHEIAVSQKAAGNAQKTLGNMGWAYYKLGDLEKAQGMLIDARNQAEKLGQKSSAVGWLTTAGYVYMDRRDFKVAEKSFLDSLDLANQIKSPEDIVNAQIALAFVYEQTGKLDQAKHYADDALTKTQEHGNGRDRVYPLLIEGRIAARQNDVTAAEAAFNEVAQSKDTPVFLKWEAERSLAHLYEDDNQADRAEHEYRTALNTFETARSELQREDSRLPFLTNAARIYDDYIHFLIAKGKTAEALRVAEFSRGRTLAEGLGMLKKGTSFNPEPLNAPAVARKAGGTILFYALGEERSYLWAITPQRVSVFPISATKTEIEAAVQRYRKKIEGPRGVLDASNDASDLYQTLVAPAQEVLTKELSAKNGRVFIVPDGGLNSLNFETLAPQPKHYWLEDVTITNAGSLRMLAATRANSGKLAGRLLLVGNPVSPETGADNSYPELPNSAAEMEGVAKHFPAAQQTVFTREQATPAGYLASNLEQFSYIHFVAHGTASRTNPLDSAIILSRDPASKLAAQDDSFKLYAREIIRHPLRAELVTISACDSAGKRSYSGEGLVGLSWAFLRAGAHNVVGALWDVSDTSVTQLMDEFYGELEKGRNPDAALRAAKLRLLHSENNAYRSPFYWAPFQLYTGSRESTRKSAREASASSHAVREYRASAEQPQN